MSSVKDSVQQEEETESHEEESYFDDDSKDNEEENLYLKKGESPSDNLQIVFPYYTRIEEEDGLHVSVATQTPIEFQKPSKMFTIDHFLHNCIGGTLIEKYHETVLDYIENVNINELSALRSEICERIQKRIKFQRCTFGNISKSFDEQPQNLYSVFNVSLYLVLYPDHFTFSTSQKGYEITGSIDDKLGRSILSYVSRGLLKPGLLTILKNKDLLKNLSWYDGCLICEIIDCRRAVSRRVRTQLRISQYDIQPYGIDSEQSFILAQNPLICLDTSTSVANVARAAMRDRLRWEPEDLMSESNLQFVARRRPDLFLQGKEKNESESQISSSIEGKFSRPQQKKYRQKMIESMLGISFQDVKEEKK